MYDESKRPGAKITREPRPADCPDGEMPPLVKLVICDSIEAFSKFATQFQADATQPTGCTLRMVRSVDELRGYSRGYTEIIPYGISVNNPIYRQAMEWGMMQYLPIDQCPKPIA